METDPLVTWKPCPGDSNPSESPDDSDYSNDSGMFHRVFAAMTKPGRPSGSGRFFSRWNRQQVNGRHVTSATSDSRRQDRRSYWGTTGPIFESNKISGNYVQIPVVAPPTAPAEQKKMILTQTTKKLENISADWSSKADFLFERFSGVCANVRNEAELRISKLEDFTSDVYEFSSAVGLTVQMGHSNISGRYFNTTLKYLQMDLQLTFGNLATPDKPIPGLPGPRSLQVVMKLPTDPQNRDQLHPGLTQGLLGRPSNLLAYMKATDLPMEFGIVNTRSNLFDPGLWEREYKKFFHECLFHAMKAGLFRDYVGDSVVHDTHTRLQRCKQATVVNGKYIVKRIEDFHSEFMLIVHEFDSKKPIPCNLAQIEFHNLIKKFQDKLIANQYKLPQQTGDAIAQYTELALLKDAALKVEKEFDQITDTIRSVSGVKRSHAPSTSAFLGQVGLEEFADNVDFEQMEEGSLDDRDVQMHHALLASHLSVAEQALRDASGERTPLKCWGCGSFPEYAKDCFHRFAVCPRQTDPRVHQAFQEKVKSFGNRRWNNSRSGHYGPSQDKFQKKPRAMLAPLEIQQDWEALGFPNKEVAVFVANSMASTNLEPADRAQMAEGFSHALDVTRQSTKSPEEKPMPNAMLANMGISQPPTIQNGKAPPFTVLMVTPVLRVQSQFETTSQGALAREIPIQTCPGDWAGSWRESLPWQPVQTDRSDLLFLPQQLRSLECVTLASQEQEISDLGVAGGLPIVPNTNYNSLQQYYEMESELPSFYFCPHCPIAPGSRVVQKFQDSETDCQARSPLPPFSSFQSFTEQTLITTATPNSNIAPELQHDMEKNNDSSPCGQTGVLTHALHKASAPSDHTSLRFQRDMKNKKDHPNTKSKHNMDSNQGPHKKLHTTYSHSPTHNPTGTAMGTTTNVLVGNSLRDAITEVTEHSPERAMEDSNKYPMKDFIYALSTKLDDLLTCFDMEDQTCFDQILSWYYWLSKQCLDGYDITSAQATIVTRSSEEGVSRHYDSGEIQLRTVNAEVACVMNHLLNQAMVKYYLPQLQPLIVAYGDTETEAPTCGFNITSTVSNDQANWEVNDILHTFDSQVEVSKEESRVLFKVKTPTETMPTLLKQLLVNRLIEIHDKEIIVTSFPFGLSMSARDWHDQTKQQSSLYTSPGGSDSHSPDLRRRRKLIRKAQRHALCLGDMSPLFADSSKNCSFKLLPSEDESSTHSSTSVLSNADGHHYNHMSYATEQDPPPCVDLESGELLADLNNYFTHTFLGQLERVPEDIVEELHARDRSVLLNPFIPYREVQETHLGLKYSQDSELYGVLLGLMIDASNQKNDRYMLEFFRWGQYYPEEIDMIVEEAIANRWITRQDFLLLSRESGVPSTNFASHSRHHFVPFHPVEIQFHERADPPRFFQPDDEEVENQDNYQPPLQDALDPQQVAPPVDVPLTAEQTRARIIEAQKVIRQVADHILRLRTSLGDVQIVERQEPRQVPTNTACENKIRDAVKSIQSLLLDVDAPVSEKRLWTYADRDKHIANLQKMLPTGPSFDVCERMIMKSRLYYRRSEYCDELSNVALAVCIDTGSPTSMLSLRHLQRFAQIPGPEQDLYTYVMTHAEWLAPSLLQKRSVFEVKGKIRLPFAPIRLFETHQGTFQDAFTVQFFLADEIAPGFHWPCLLGLKDLHRQAVSIDTFHCPLKKESHFGIRFQPFPGHSYYVWTLDAASHPTMMMDPLSDADRQQPIVLPSINSPSTTDLLPAATNLGLNHNVLDQNDLPQLHTKHPSQTSLPRDNSVKRQKTTVEEVFVSMEEYKYWQSYTNNMIAKVAKYKGDHAYFSSRDHCEETLEYREIQEHKYWIKELNNQLFPTYPVFEASIPLVLAAPTDILPHTKVITKLPVSPMYTQMVEPHSSAILHSITSIPLEDIRDRSLRVMFVWQYHDDSDVVVNAKLSNQYAKEPGLMQPIIEVKNNTEKPGRWTIRHTIGQLYICKSTLEKQDSAYVVTSPGKDKSDQDDRSDRGGSDGNDSQSFHDGDTNQQHHGTYVTGDGSASESPVNNSASQEPEPSDKHFIVSLGAPSDFDTIDQSYACYKYYKCPVHVHVSPRDPFPYPHVHLLELPLHFTNSTHVHPQETVWINTSFVIPPHVAHSLTSNMQWILWVSHCPQSISFMSGFLSQRSPMDPTSMQLSVQTSCCSRRRGRNLLAGEYLGVIRCFPALPDNNVTDDTTAISCITDASSSVTASDSQLPPSASWDSCPPKPNPPTGHYTTLDPEITPLTGPTNTKTEFTDLVLRSIDNPDQLDGFSEAVLEDLVGDLLPTLTEICPPGGTEPLRTVACLILVRCYQSFVRGKPYPVAVSDTLPHILFPLGKYSPDVHWKHSEHLRAVFDSGAGVSLGYLPFFQDLYEKKPHLVHTFARIDLEVFAEILVGNIDKHCDAASCTHYIELYTPFMDQGQPVTMRIALSPVLSVNALFGLPFILKAKMVPHFADSFVRSDWFQTTFPLEFMTPVLQECLPQQDGQSAPAFVSKIQQTQPSLPAPAETPHTSQVVLDPNNPKATSK